MTSILPSYHSSVHVHSSMFSMLIADVFVDLASQPARPTHTQQYIPQNTPKNWQSRYPSQSDAAEEPQREPEVRSTSKSLT